MESLITSYLLQNKECVLPGIGILQINNIPASFVAGTNQLFPPAEEITFKAETHLNSPGLIKYISNKKHIDLIEAEKLLINFCKEWKDKVHPGEKLSFETIGTLQRNEDDKIYFEKEPGFNFFNTVVVDEVYKPQVTKVEVEAEDKIDLPPQNISEENEVKIKRLHWGWWAAILTAIGFATIFFYFKDQRSLRSSAGNFQHIIVDSASPTYTTPR